MPKYVIKRDVPGAGKLSPSELQGICQKSSDVLRDLGSDVQWVQSYVTDDGFVCVYNAVNEEIVREHARRAGFPCNEISRVGAIVDSTTAEVTV